MRTPLLPIALLLLTFPVRAQLHAGEVPDGMSAIDMDIDLVLTGTFTEDAASLEVDCDDQPDMMAVLIHGAPPIDAPNVATLNVLYGDLELCKDLSGSSGRPKYHAFGEALDPTGIFEWHSDSVNVLGDFGSLSAIGPTTIDSMYVAYRRGTTVGWILLSFELAGDLAVHLKIHQVLPICPSTTSIASHGLVPAMTLFPNPSNGGPIRVECSEALRSIDVLDPSGRILAQYNGTVRTIQLPDVAGAYLVQAWCADGGRSTARLVRY